MSNAARGVPAPVSENTVLDVRDLRKEFFIHAIGRRVHALNGVNLTVTRGEHVAIVGESGAGKSTLLKCVWRSVLPSAGQIWLRRSNDSADDSPNYSPHDSLADSAIDLATADDAAIIEARKHDLAYVSQFLRPDCRRSVLQVVGRAAIRRGLEPAGAATAAEAALRRVNLTEDLWGTQPVVLSGGEQQRVNLAAGTLCPPRLLLLDEPVAALDEGHRETVLRLIRELSQAGVSVLSVFHDLDVVRALAHRVVVLHDGQVVADGPPAQILDQTSAA
jgi:alpha-D-ribose 1-methylphosphonate 5-triphosphate synthase subunit PhnL